MKISPFLPFVSFSLSVEKFCFVLFILLDLYNLLIFYSQK